MKVKFLRFSLFPILITEGPPPLRSSSWRPLENQPDPLPPSILPSRTSESESESGRSGLHSIECGGIEIPRVFSFLPQTDTAPTTPIHLPRPGCDDRRRRPLRGQNKNDDNKTNGNSLNQKCLLRRRRRRRRGWVPSRPVPRRTLAAARDRPTARGSAGGPTSRSPPPPSPHLRGAPKERQQDQRNMNARTGRDGEAV